VVEPDERAREAIDGTAQSADAAPPVPDRQAMPETGSMPASDPAAEPSLPGASADEDITEGLEETVSQMDILASFIPPRVKMTDGLSASMIDQLPVAVLIHAGDQLIHANPEFMRLTGYSSLEALSDVGGLDALLQRHDLEEKGGRPGAMMLVTVEDELVPVSARLQSIRWEQSSALMLALLPADNDASVPARDIAPAETRMADRMIEKVAKLQVEVEELRSILETATDGVVVIGAEGDIRSMNRSASALFNYDEEETRGKPFVMLFAHESQRAVLDYLNGLSGHGVASVLNDGREVIGREATGGFVQLFMTMGRLTSSSGYCAVIRDITQWKRTEDELRGAKSAAETANAHKTDFLARVSHEIRTPLNAIIGFSDMMAGERFGPIGHPRYVEYANDIGRSGRHVLDIVNDLLDISKIEAGEMDLDFGAISLNEAISEAVALLQPQANSQRVIIRTALSHAVPDVVADLRSIKQIALNILSNSIRFTPSGGQIVVSTSYETNGSVVLRIRDTGVGMTRSELDQAMKPFRQVSTQSRHWGEGTGLGLPLTKAMVDANRAIFAISSTPNEGTLVEIAFPSQRVLAV
jgi:PAS domain S-box-containing protein